MGIMLKSIQGWI